MRERDDDELEALLDAALTSYARAEREDEAAARVQARTMAAVRGSTFSVKKIAWALWALPVAAVLVLAALLVPEMLSKGYRGATVVREMGAGVVAQRTIAPMVEPREAEIRRVDMTPRRGHSAAKHRDVPEILPKLEVFPTPRPLTAEEVAFMKFAAAQTKQADHATAPPDPQPIVPLTIAAIEIQPLDTSSKDPNP